MESLRSRTGMAMIGIAALALVLHVVTAKHDPTGGLVHEVLYLGLLFGSGIACLARVALRRAGRLPWTLVGLAIIFWAGGDLYWTLALSDMAEPPYPSLADAGWLAMYPLMYVAVLILLREMLQHVSASMWLDGLVGACAFTALGIAVVFQPILNAAAVGTSAEIATNLAYPVGDLLLLALMVVVCSITGWRPGARWSFFAAALAVSAVADGAYLYQVTMGTYTPESMMAVLWPLSTVLFAIAAWQPRPAARGVVHEGWGSVAMPAVFSFIAIALLVYDHFVRLGDAAIALAGAALAVGAVRAGLTFKDYLAMLSTSRDEAKTDPLTGLANRRALTNELERRVLLEPDRPFGLALFDLDGFKSYNDAFGHTAGDDLLHRLATRLDEALPPEGTAYRLGGDEFCVLVWLTGSPFAAVAKGLNGALKETGHGFNVTSSVGTVLVPEESTDTRVILTLADRRMYADKTRKRSSVGSQTRDVLLSLLRERESGLDRHMEEVAVLAQRVGREMKLDGETLDEVVRAAELHDIGKLALPDSILNKPGPLTEPEWEFMRGHTLIGERILSSAPALLPVASIVRSSHERWDGGGYPDGLTGDEIPLGARIVFVCDSFDAITSDRAYARGRSPAEAAAEIRRCAGTQFDPDVVLAFLAVLSDQQAQEVADLALTR